MEDYEGLKGAIAEVASDKNLREDYIRNEFLISVLYPEDPRKYDKMENTLNYVYTEFKKNKTRRGELMGPPTPGMFVTVLDQFKDHIGRFKRALIIPPPEEEADFTNELLGDRDFVFCKLLDEGTVRTFPTSKLYSLLEKFLMIPPRVVRVQLMDLGEFHGSSKFGRHLEALLSRCVDFDITGVMLNPTPGGPLLVKLYSVEMKQTLNQILLQQLCSPSQDNYTETLSNRGDTTSVHPGFLTHFTPDGEALLRYNTRAGVVVESCLKEIGEAWDEKSGERYQCDQEIIFGNGSVAIGLHPQKRRMCRCVIVGSRATKEALAPKPRKSKDLVSGGSGSADKPAPKRPVWVQWIDWGDESEVFFEDLLLGKLYNPVMDVMKPQAIKYQLANVKYLKSDSYLNHIRVGQSKLTVRVLSKPEYVPEALASSFPPAYPAVELLANHLPHGSLHSRVKNVNRKLLKLRQAAPESRAISYRSPPFVHSTGICRFPTELQAQDWLVTPASSSADFSLVLKPNDKIAFYVGETVRSSSGETLTIHPWATKGLYDNLKKGLRHYFEGFDWVRGDWRKFERDRSPPNETFCAYNHSETWYRAKIIQELKRQFSDTHEIDKYLGDQLVEVLLIDEGKYVEAEFTSVAKVFPLTRFVNLGPQGARVLLNSSKLLESPPQGPKKDEEIERDKKRAALEKRIKKLGAKGEKIVAVIEGIQTDDHGRVYVSLLPVEDTKKKQAPL